MPVKTKVSILGGKKVSPLFARNELARRLQFISGRLTTSVIALGDMSEKEWGRIKGVLFRYYRERYNNDLPRLARNKKITQKYKRRATSSDIRRRGAYKKKIKKAAKKSAPLRFRKSDALPGRKYGPRLVSRKKGQRGYGKGEPAKTADRAGKFTGYLYKTWILQDLQKGDVFEIFKGKKPGDNFLAMKFKLSRYERQYPKWYDLWLRNHTRMKGGLFGLTNTGRRRIRNMVFDILVKRELQKEADKIIKKVRSQL